MHFISNRARSYGFNDQTINLMGFLFHALAVWTESPGFFGKNIFVVLWYNRNEPIVSLNLSDASKYNVFKTSLNKLEIISFYNMPRVARIGPSDI